jgi:choice-of-anchor B domain-containing protein
MKRTVLFLIVGLVFFSSSVSSQTLKRDRSEQGTNTRSIAGFSSTVIVDGETILVSESGNTMTSGFVYIYRKDSDGKWQESGRLTAGDAHDGDRFGTALSLSGDLLAVSATGNGGGLIYLFERSPDGWAASSVVSGEGSSDGDGFGSAIALDGNFMVIGASAAGGNAGAVYAFSRNTDGAWSQESIIVAPDSSEGDRFGAALALSGDRLLVGAPGKNRRTGTAYAYAREDHEWKHKEEVSPFGLERNNRFGSLISIKGDRALITAPFYQRSMGAVFLFESDEDRSWSRTMTQVPFDAGANLRYGTTAAFVGDDLWVGATGANNFLGAVYAVRGDGNGGWSSVEKIIYDESVRGSQFGASLASGDHLAVIGQPNVDFGSGAAVVYAYENGEWVQSSVLRGDIEGLDSITGDEVRCEGGKSNRFDCDSIDMVSMLSIKDMGGTRGVKVNDVWGWTDPTTEKEYALVGRMDGTSFVDVTDASHPRYLGQLMRTEGSPASIWRDIKVYRDYAFIVSDAAKQHGVQIFDLRKLRDVSGDPVDFEEDGHYDGIASAHNIVINEDTGFAYTVGSSGGGETCGGGLHMINVQDPLHPEFAGCFADPTTGRASTGYSHDAMCVTYHGPDVEHSGQEICFGANETALSIANVSDKENPVSLSSAAYPSVGYAHQGWITDDHRFFYLNDELDEISGSVKTTRTLIWDVTDLDDPQLVKEYMSDVASSDHNLYVRGNYMYQSNYVSGLRVYDISDPENPVPSGYFDTEPFGENKPGFDGTWSNYPYFKSGIILVTSMKEGLFVLKRSEVDI